MNELIDRTIDAEIERLGAALGGKHVTRAASTRQVNLPLEVATMTPLQVLEPDGWHRAGNVYVDMRGELLAGIPKRQAEMAPPAAHSLTGRSPVRASSPGGTLFTDDETAAILGEVCDSALAGDTEALLKAVLWPLRSLASNHPRTMTNLVNVLVRLGREKEAISTLRAHSQSYVEHANRDGLEAALKVASTHFLGDPVHDELQMDINRFERSIHRLGDVYPFSLLSQEACNSIEERHPAQSHPARIRIIARGAHDPPLVIIQSGVAEIHLQDPPGTPDGIRFAGDVLGEISLTELWERRKSAGSPAFARNSLAATASVIPLENFKAWVIPQHQFLALADVIGVAELERLVDNLAAVARRRLMDSYLASAEWLRGLLLRRPSQADRDELLGSASKPQQCPAGAVVVANGEPAPGAFIVARGGLMEIDQPYPGGGEALTYYEPGDAWGVSEARLGCPARLSRKVEATHQPTVLIPVTIGARFVTPFGGT